MLRNARNDSPAEPAVCKSIVLPDFLLKSAHEEQDKSAHSFYSGIVKAAPGLGPSTWIFFVQSSHGSVECLIQTSYSASCCVLADPATRARSAWLGTVRGHRSMYRPGLTVEHDCRCLRQSWSTHRQLLLWGYAPANQKYNSKFQFIR
jgi:hypothetical protein